MKRIRITILATVVAVLSLLTVVSLKAKNSILEAGFGTDFGCGCPHYACTCVCNLQH